jgi:hypothetical protein
MLRVDAADVLLGKRVPIVHSATAVPSFIPGAVNEPRLA